MKITNSKSKSSKVKSVKSKTKNNSPILRNSFDDKQSLVSDINEEIITDWQNDFPELDSCIENNYSKPQLHDSLFSISSYIRKI